MIEEKKEGSGIIGRKGAEQPSYLRLLETGELERRVEAMEAMLESCHVCPRDCLNNRLKDEIAVCFERGLYVSPAQAEGLHQVVVHRVLVDVEAGPH